MKRMMYDTMITVMLIVVIFGGATIARLINNNYTREGIVVAIHASTEEVGAALSKFSKKMNDDKFKKPEVEYKIL